MAWPNSFGDTALFNGGAGLVTLTSTVNVGTIVFGTAGYSIAGGGASLLNLGDAGVAGSGTIQADNTGVSTINAVVAGSNGLTLSSSTTGTLQVGGANTFTGGVTIASGTLGVTTNTGLGDAVNGITFTGAGAGGLAINGPMVLSRSLTFNNGATSATLNSGLGGTNLAVTGSVTGAGGLAMLNTGTTSLTNAGGFSGVLWAQAGTAAVTSLHDTAGDGNLKLGNLATTGTFQWGAGGLGALNLTNRAIELAGTTGGGTIDSSNNTASSTVTINKSLVISGTGARTLTLTGNNGGANLFAGSIADGTGSAIALTKTGTGLWVLSSNANAYSGATTISQGTLRLTGGANSAGMSSGFTFGSLGAVLELRSDSSVKYGVGITNNLSPTAGLSVLYVDRAVGGTGSNGTATLGPIAGLNSTGMLNFGGDHGYNLKVGVITVKGASTVTTINNLGAPGYVAPGYQLGAMSIGGFTTDTTAGSAVEILSGWGDYTALDGTVASPNAATALSITKSNLGLLSFSGNNAAWTSTTKGTLSTTAGITRVLAANANAIGGANLALSGGLLEIRSNTDTDFSSKSLTFSGASTLVAAPLLDGAGTSGHTLTLGALTSAATGLTYSLDTNHQYGITFTGTISNGSNLNNGYANIGTGLVTFAGPLSLGTTVMNYSGNGDFLVSGTQVSNSAITKSGFGVLTYSGVGNNFTGTLGVAVNQGVLRVATSTALGGTGVMSLKGNQTNAVGLDFRVDGATTVARVMGQSVNAIINTDQAIGGSVTGGTVTLGGGISFQDDASATAFTGANGYSLKFGGTTALVGVAAGGVNFTTWNYVGAGGAVEFNGGLKFANTAGTVTYNNAGSGDYLFSGPLTAATSTGISVFNKNGSGVATFSADNSTTFSGANARLNLNAGVTRITSAKSLGGPLTQVNLNGGVLDLRSNAAMVILPGITVAGDAVINVDRAVGGTGTGATHSTAALAIGPVNLYFTGGANSGGNTYNLTAGNITLSGAATLINNLGNGGLLTLPTLQGGQAVTLAGGSSTLVSGSTALAVGNITKNGLGTATFTNPVADNATGNLILNAGTLVADYSTGAAKKIFSSTATVTFGGGALQLKGAATGNSSLDLSNVKVNAGPASIALLPQGAGTTTLNAGTLTTTAGGSLLVTAPANGFVTFNSVLLAPDGRSVFSDGTNFNWLTNSGVTTNSAGYAAYALLALTAGSDTNNSLLSADSTTLGARTTNSLKISTGAGSQSLALGGVLTLQNGGLLVTGASSFAITGIGVKSGGSELTLSHYGTADLTLSAPILESAAGSSFTKAGPGTVIVGDSSAANLNTYTGLTTVNGGTLRLVNATRLGASDSQALAVNTGTFDVNGNSLGLGALTGGVAGKIDNTGASAATLTVGNGNAAGAFFGAIRNSGGALSVSKVGNGALTVGDVPSGGSNEFTGDLTLRGGTVSLATLADAGNLVFAGGNLTYTGNRNLTLNSRAIVLTGEGVAPTITANGVVGANGLAGIVTLNTSITPGATSTNDVITFAGASGIAQTSWVNTLGGTIADPSSGGGLTSLSFTHSGAWQLTGNNTFTGGITMAGTGSLRFTSAGSVNSTIPNTIALQNGTLEFRSDSSVAFNTPIVWSANNAVVVADRAIDGAGYNQVMTLGSLTETTGGKSLSFRNASWSGAGMNGGNIVNNYGVRIQGGLGLTDGASTTIVNDLGSQGSATLAQSVPGVGVAGALVLDRVDLFNSVSGAHTLNLTSDDLAGGVTIIAGDLTQASGTNTLGLSITGGTTVGAGGSAFVILANQTFATNYTGGLVISNSKNVADTTVRATSPYSLGPSANPLTFERGTLEIRNDASVAFGNAITLDGTDNFNLYVGEAVNGTGGRENTFSFGKLSQTTAAKTLTIGGVAGSTNSSGDSVAFGSVETGVTGSTLTNNLLLPGLVKIGTGTGTALTTTVSIGIATQIFNGSGFTTLSGTLLDNGAGQLGITYSGTGFLTLEAASGSNYSGGLTATSGTIRATTPFALGAAGNAVVLNGGALEIRTDTDVTYNNPVSLPGGGILTVGQLPGGDGATGGQDRTVTFTPSLASTMTGKTLTVAGIGNTVSNNGYSVTFSNGLTTNVAATTITNNLSLPGVLTLAGIANTGTAAGTNLVTLSGFGTTTVSGAINDSTTAGAKTALTYAASAGGILNLNSPSSNFSGGLTVGSTTGALQTFAVRVNNTGNATSFASTNQLGAATNSVLLKNAVLDFRTDADVTYANPIRTDGTFDSVITTDRLVSTATSKTLTLSGGITQTSGSQRYIYVGGYNGYNINVSGGLVNQLTLAATDERIRNFGSGTLTFAFVRNESALAETNSFDSVVAPGTSTAANSLTVIAGNITQLASAGALKIDNKNGTLDLTAVNLGAIKPGEVAYSGGLTVSIGTVLTSSPLNFGTGNVTLAGGTLQFRNDASTTLPQTFSTSSGTSAFDFGSASGTTTGKAITLNTVTIASGTVTFNGRDGYTANISNYNLPGATGANSTIVANIPVTIGAVVNPEVGFTSGSFDTMFLDGIAGGTITGVIADASGGSVAAGGTTRITKNGAATWTLAGANSNYSGITTVNSGTLQLGAVNAISTASPVTVSATGANVTATLDLHGNNQTLNGNATAAGLTLSGSTATSAPQVLIGNSVLTLGNATTAALAYSGSGLTGLVTAGGGTGSVVLSAANAIFNVGHSATNIVSSANPMGADVLIDAPLIEESTTGGLGKSGAGVLALTNANNVLTKTLDIQNGALAIGVLANNSSPLLLGNLTTSGTIQYYGTTPVNLSTRVLTLNGTTGGGGLENDAADPLNTITIGQSPVFGAVASGNKTFILGGSNTGANTFSGVLSDNGASVDSLTKSGAGNWIVSASQTYTGTTTVTGGTLRFTNGSTLAATSSASVNAASGNATLDLGNNAAAFGNATTSALTFAGAAGNTPQLLFGNGNLTLTSAIAAVNYNAAGNPLAGLLSANGGSGKVILGTANEVFNIGHSTANVITADNPLGADLIISAPVLEESTTGGLTKTGAGFLALTNPGTTVTKALDIQNGTVSLPSLTNNATALLLGSTTTSGVLQYNGTTPFNLTRTFTLNGTTGGGGFENSSADPLNTLTLNAAPVFAVSASGAKTFTLGGSNTGANVFSGALANNGTSVTSFTKTGTGTWTISGNNSYTGATTVSQGTLNATGQSAAAPAAASTLTVGTVVGNAVLNVSGTMTGAQLSAGTIAGANAALNLLPGGTVAFNLPENTDAIAGFGITLGAYGALNMTGGTFNTARFQFGGAGGAGTGGTGVGLVSGGTVNTTGYFILSRNGSAAGVLTISGGQINHTGAGQNLFLGLQGAGRAELNVDGGVIDNTGRTVSFSGSGFVWTGSGVLNLNAGTLLTNGIVYGSGSAIANFSGATIKAAAASTSFIGGIPSAYVNGAFGSFAGGAVFDTNGFNITVSQPLLKPTGNGVSTLAVADGGSGYIGAPYVSVSGGGGTGATAIANMVDDGTGNGTFKIGSITVTNPGVDYTTAPTLTFTGGGSTVLATTGNATLAANTSGGLIKTGAGALTLSGLNTFTGNTSVTGGLLRLTVGSSYSGAITIDGGMFDDQGATGNFTVITKNGLVTLSNPSDTLADIGITSTSHGVVALSQPNSSMNGFVGSDVYLGAVGARIYSGATLSAGAGNTYRFGGGLALSSQIATLSSSGGYLQITTPNVVTGANKVIIGDNGGAGILGGASTVEFTSAQNFTDTLTLKGGQLVFSDISALGAPTTPAGSIVFDGGALRYGSSTQTDDISARAVIASGATISIPTGGTVNFASILGNAAGSIGGLTKIGPGTLKLSAVNSYAGATTVSQGTLVLDLNAAAANNVVTASSAGLNLGGGNLSVIGTGGTTSARSQAFTNGTTFSAGASTITPTLAASSTLAPALTLNLGALSRTSGATGNIVFATGNTTAANTTLASSSGTASSLVIDVNGAAYLTFGTSATSVRDWAVKDSTNAKVVQAPATGFYTAATATTIANNADIGALSPTITGAVGDNTTKSIRFDNAGARTLTLNGATSTFSTGGILVTSNVGNAATIIAGSGTLRGPNGGAGDLVVHNWDTSNSLTINAIIGGTGGLTKSGSGNLILGTATNTYSGQTVIDGGTLSVDSTLRFGATSGITLNGGTLALTALAAGLPGAPEPFTLGLGGGTINATGDGAANLGIAGDQLRFQGLGARSLTIGGVINRRTSVLFSIGDNGGSTSVTYSGVGDTSVLVPAVGNSYTGLTTLTRGVLELAVPGSIPGGLGSPTPSGGNTGGGNLLVAGGSNRAILQLRTAAGDFFRPLGTGFDQVQFTGNGGFANGDAGIRIVNFGAAGAAVTWGSGGFLPNGSTFQFGQAATNSANAIGSIDFQNDLALGAAIRTVDVNDGVQTAGGSGFDVTFSGNLTTTSNVGSLTKTGVGVLRLTGNNSAGSNGTSTITVAAGTIAFGGATPTDSILGAAGNRTVTLQAGGAATLLNSPVGPLIDRVTTDSAGAVLLSVSDTNVNSTIDLSLLPSVSLGAFNEIAGVPVYFGGSILPANNLYRIGNGAGTATGGLGVSGTAVQFTQNIFALTKPYGLTDNGATPRTVNFASGVTYLTAPNNYTGGSLFAVTTTSFPANIGVGNDAAFGPGALTLTTLAGAFFGSINGDHAISNDLLMTGANVIVLASNDTRRGFANAGAATYYGKIQLSSTTTNIYSEAGRNVILLGNVGPVSGTAAVTFFSNGGGTDLSLTKPLGAVEKTFTSSMISDSTILVIDSDRSLGIVPATGANNVTFNSGTLALQAGIGTVALSGLRNFVIAANELPIFNIPGAPAGGAVGNSTLAIPGSISGGGTSTVTKTGLGTLALSGASTFTATTGGVQVLAGTLQLDYANYPNAATGNPILPATLQLTLGAATTNSNGGTLLVSNGASAVTQNFSATVTTAKDNFITLTTTGGAVNLGLGGITRAVGGTLNFGGNALGTGAIASSTAAVNGVLPGATWGGTDLVAASGTALTRYAAYTTPTGATPTIANAAANNVKVDATSTGTTVLAAGTTIVNTLTFSDPAARTIGVGTGNILRLGTVGAILVAPTAGALTIGVSGTAGTLAAGGATGSGELQLINNSANTLTINSVIANSVTGTTPITTLIKSGSGVVTLAGNNTYTGNTYVNSGVLQYSDASQLGRNLGSQPVATSNVIMNGGTLRYTGTGSNAALFGMTFGTVSAFDVPSATGTVVLGTATSGSGTVGTSGLVGALQKTGAGTLTFGGTQDNNNLSAQVLGGTLNLAKTLASAHSIGANANAGLIVENGAVAILGVTGGDQIYDLTSVVVKAGGVFNLANASEAIDGLAGSGTVTGTGGTLTLGGTAGATNNLANIGANTVAAANAGVGSTGLNNFSGTISGTISLVKFGAGTQILSGTESYTYNGSTTISAGTLRLASVNVLPSGPGLGDVFLTGNTTIGGLLAPGTLDLGGYDQAINGLSSTTGGIVTSTPTLSNNGTTWGVNVGTAFSTTATTGVNTLTVGSGNNATAMNFNGVLQDGYTIVPGATARGVTGQLALNKVGSGVQILSGANTYSGGTTVTGGTLQAANANALGATTAPVTLAGGTLDLGGNSPTVGVVTIASAAAGNTLQNGSLTGSAYNVTNPTGNAIVAAGLLGAGPLTKSGAGTLTLNGPVNGPSVDASNGRVNFGAGDTNPANPSHSLASLTIENGARVRLTAGGAKFLKATSLSLASTATFDLTNNTFLLDYPGTAEDTAMTDQVAGLLKTGFNGGTWDGLGGITTSLVTNAQSADPLHYQYLTALGYAGGTMLGGSLQGRAVDASSVVVRFTYYGDATLDGVVNGSDYSLIDSAYLALHDGNPNTTAAVNWINGDFNYDGVIDGADYALIDTTAAFTSGQPISDAFIQQREDQFGATYTQEITRLQIAVPEPTSFGLLVLGGGLLAGRRRRSPVRR